MQKTNLESCTKYIIVARLFGKEYSLPFMAIDEVADYLEKERDLEGVYRVQIIKLPWEVYTRRTEKH